MPLQLYTAILFFPGDPKAPGNAPKLWRNVSSLKRLRDNAAPLGILYINVYEKVPKGTRSKMYCRIWIKENIPVKNSSNVE